MIKRNLWTICVVSVISLLILSACVKPSEEKEPWHLVVNTPLVVGTGQPLKTPYLPATRLPNQPILSPTPDAPRVMPTLRTEPESYVVQPNDSLSAIAQSYAVDLNALIQVNPISNINILEIGQVLEIPAADPNMRPSNFKIIPNSELVYGPSCIGFDVAAFLSGYNGYLSGLSNSAEVVQQAAEDYSVNPRILLTLLEYRTGWLTGPRIVEATETPSTTPTTSPTDAWETDLFNILSKYANLLNGGYYRWQENRLGYYVLSDGSYVPAGNTINAGTAAIQYWAGVYYGKLDWQLAVSEYGVFFLYEQLFGYPFDYSVDPLIPADVKQPEFELPMQPGIAWSFTGGPHPSWGDGTAWGALDFAPPGSPMGCSVSGDWVTALADGVILRSENGAVIQDLDGDGYEQTGWVILYLHLSSWERVEAGDVVKIGDFIGHPSCEGGVSSGTHLHLARRYNGEWIPADGALPFVMSGYSAVSTDLAYNGYLVRNGETIEAWDRFRTESLIQR
ncbi:MAG: hypothetical protein CVU39_25085 [Chloroflexi bacterium HGW-Chloroflexi-10]|nr:MAG: hypothetical protein CVU39_25085 [Chloroflexi bacterium HGW-Chloroflexi-10]